jgi:flagellar biogenesis protein FliO
MEEIRQVLSVFAVLALLGGALWWLRSKGVAQFAVKTRGAGKGKSLRVVERLALTPQHSLHLVRVGGRNILVASSPGGCSILDNLPEMDSPAGLDSLEGARR